MIHAEWPDVDDRSSRDFRKYNAALWRMWMNALQRQADKDKA